MELMPAIRALHLAALALLAGGFAFPLLVLPLSLAAQPERSVLRGWLARLRLSGALLALVTWLAWLVLVAAGMSGLPLAEATHPSVLEAVVFRTRFGQVWAIRFALLVLMLAWLLAMRRGSAPQDRESDSGGCVLAALLLLSQVWAGHATAAPPLHVAADALHLAAAALWTGSLPPLLLLLGRTGEPTPSWNALAAAAARGFTGLGVFAVGALAITGLFHGRMMVGNLDALASTGYGRLVAAKIVLFAAMLALAAANRFWLTPRLALANGAPSAAARILRRNVAAEIVLGACILAIVGALGGTQPPAHAPAPGVPMQHPMDGAHHH
jgi:putative copper resistance protein D